MKQVLRILIGLTVLIGCAIFAAQSASDPIEAFEQEGFGANAPLSGVGKHVSLIDRLRQASSYFRTVEGYLSNVKGHDIALEGRQIFKGFSPDMSKFVLEVGHGPFLPIKFYNAKDNAPLDGALEIYGFFEGFSPDGDLFVVKTREGIKFYNTDSRIPRSEVLRIDGLFKGFSPDGSLFVVQRDLVRILNFYNVHTYERINPEARISGEFQGFNSDGSLFLVGSGRKCQWYTTKGAQPAGEEIPVIGSVVGLSPNGLWFASKDQVENKLYFYNAKSGALISQKENIEGDFRAFSPDGRLFVIQKIGNDVGARIYSVRDGTLVDKKIGQGIYFREFAAGGALVVLKNRNVVVYPWFSYLQATYALQKKDISLVNKQLRLLEGFGYVLEKRSGVARRVFKFVGLVGEGKEERIVLTDDQKVTFRTLPKWMARALLPYVGAEIKKDTILKSKQLEFKKGNPGSLVPQASTSLHPLQKIKPVPLEEAGLGVDDVD